MMNRARLYVPRSVLMSENGQLIQTHQSGVSWRGHPGEPLEEGDGRYGTGAVKAAQIGQFSHRQRKRPRCLFTFAAL